MSNKIEIPAEEVKRYAEFYLAMQRGYDYKNHKIEEGYQDCDGDFFIPVGLSDEDRFICALIHLYSYDFGLTTRRLMKWFGWTKYRCYKLARANQYCRTVTLICEEGGYGGTGWLLLSDMFDAMREYRKCNYPCIDCKKLTSIENSRYYPSRSNIIGYCSYDSQYSVFEDSGCRTGKFER